MCFMLFIGLIGCDDEPSLNPEGFTEFKTDISGIWKISNVTQNGIDITNSLDFKSFALNLDYNGTTPSNFSLASKSPFVTKISEGSWSFDDPIYPTIIIFSDGSSAKLLKPILSSGEKSLNLEIVLGCGNMVYQYKLIK